MPTVLADFDPLLIVVDRAADGSGCGDQDAGSRTTAWLGAPKWAG
jgi:hypothetical protein